MAVSRHNVSQANQLFRGKATLGGYQADKLGVQWNPLSRWYPTGNRKITFTADLAAGATAGTLTANWGPPTGLYQITFPDGEVVTGYFQNANTAVSFYPASPPVSPSLSVPSYGNLEALQNTQTVATAVVAGAPPVIAVAAAYLASQAVASGGFGVFSTGSLYYNAAYTYNGVAAPAGVPDVPRNFVAAWTGTAVMTVQGLDYWGQAQSEVSASGTSFTGKKTYSVILSVSFSAAVTAATAGFGNVLGLPFKTVPGDIYAINFGGAADAGTIVAPDLTQPATTSSGDVRGTYTPAGTLNGNTFLSALLHTDASTQFGAFGVTPV